MNKLVLFLKDVRVELAKVTWPTRQELVRYTIIVIVASLAIAAFLGAFDFLFQFILQKVIVK